MHLDMAVDSGTATQLTWRHAREAGRTSGMSRADKAVGAILLVLAVSSALFLGTSLGHPSATTTTQSGPKEYEYPTANASSAISAAVGEVFIIQLNSNAGSTGFDWNVTSSTGIHYINYTAVTDNPMIIGGEVRHYYFRALASGNQSITLLDVRAFDPSHVAARIDLRVTVA